MPMTNLFHKLLFEILQPRKALRSASRYKRKADEELYKNKFEDLIQRNLLFRDFRRTINSIKTHRNYSKNKVSLSNKPLSLFVESTRACF